MSDLVRVEAFNSIGPDFSQQPCSGILRELDGDRLRMRMNGTRLTFHARNSTGTGYDETAALHFQWFEVGEYWVQYPTLANPMPGCSPGAGPTDTANDQSTQRLLLKDCLCTVSSFQTIEPGYLETGYMVNISGCPAPQQAFIGTGYVSISNETRQERWNNTLPGSTYDHFYYTHMYVFLFDRNHQRVKADYLWPNQN